MQYTTGQHSLILFMEIPPGLLKQQCKNNLSGQTKVSRLLCLCSKEVNMFDHLYQGTVGDKENDLM